MDDTAKNLILRCLPDRGLDRPHGEDQLDKLHLSMSACEFLLDLGDADYHRLSDIGKMFPAAVKTFIYKTAQRFHDSKLSLPDHFLDPLEKFLRQTKSHVATTNYDNLLYLPMAQREIRHRYDNALVDGFTEGTGFLDKNMKRCFGRDFGYYLHLHGSPRFVDQGSKITKINNWQLRDPGITDSKHIVLTHIAHKPTVIDASRLLGDRQQHWKKKVGTDVSIQQLESILTFVDWQS